MKDHIANYEKIVAGRMIYDKPLSEIAQENGFSYQYARAAYNMFCAVKDEDWDRLADMVGKYNMPYDRVKWAASELGKKLPASIKKAYDEGRERDRERQKAKYEAKKEPYPDMLGWVSSEPEEEPEPQPDPEPQQAPAEIPPEVIVEYAQTKLDNTALCMRKILENQAKIIELLEQFMDVVIPKWAVHATDNANANGDAIQEMLKPIAASVDAIRCNTKKRGM